jgi:hypothetical protein
VFTVNAALGLAVSGLSYLVTAHTTGLAGHAAAVATAQGVALTFAWLIPMTAICALTLAVAVTFRSANAGAIVGVAAWGAAVLASGMASGAFTAAVTSASTYFPYLAVAACATAVIGYGTRSQSVRN